MTKRRERLGEAARMFLEHKEHRLDYINLPYMWVSQVVAAKVKRQLKRNCLSSSLLSAREDTKPPRPGNATNANKWVLCD